MANTLFPRRPSAFVSKNAYQRRLALASRSMATNSQQGAMSTRTLMIMGVAFAAPLLYFIMRPTPLKTQSGFEAHLSPTNIGEKEGAHGNDQAASSKQPGSFNTTSGKQAGLTNTDTRHSTDSHSNPDLSKKSEGTVETAKLQGSVDPKRRAT